MNIEMRYHWNFLVNFQEHHVRVGSDYFDFGFICHPDPSFAGFGLVFVASAQEVNLGTVPLRLQEVGKVGCFSHLYHGSVRVSSRPSFAN